MNSGKRKIRIELEDDEGDRYNLSLEGKFSKEKMIKVFELIESFEDKTRNESNSLTNNDTSSLGTRIWSIIQGKCNNKTFTSTFIFNIYNELYEERIQLSVISTYLSRFFARNKLGRTKNGKEWIYSIINVDIDNSTRGDYLSHTNGITYYYESPSTVYDLHQ
ncbi:MAG: hypothetical protein M3P08_14180 [Thermoproteota archaeon]|nr:hypothetical protein [Thermoproteota archaeon]